jgi:membrane protease YdiL (CAAX protease family)
MGEPSGASPPLAARAAALLVVILCSDYPTQIAIAATFAAFGFHPFDAAGHLVTGYVAALSLTDTAALLALILLFLRAHDDSPRALLFDARPIAGEALAGIPMILAALVIGAAVLIAIQRFAPSLHTVPRNPLQDLIRTPRDVWMFAVVVVVAGGVREEIQRAFLLRRFETMLGGNVVGVVVTSAAFGAGHLVQGADAAIATGTLGAFWALVYLRRRSIAANVVSHSGFNLLQIVQFIVIGR